MVTSSQRLKKIRISRGLTQMQFAELLGISQAMVSQVEAGRRTLPMTAVELLCTRLGLDPTELLRPVQPREIFGSLDRAWTAYDGARSTFIRLFDEVVKLCSVLREHKGALRTTLARDGATPSELTVFDRMSSDDFLNFYRGETPPEKTRHPHYLQLPERVGPKDPPKLDDLVRICSFAMSLDAKTLRNVGVLASRLLTVMERKKGR